MRALSISFANMHSHSDSYQRLLRVRGIHGDAERGILGQAPIDLGIDQYDTPQARWLAIQSEDGEILAGLRLMPTNARCGAYSYFLRDAQKGLLPEVPKTVLTGLAPVLADTWEASHGFIRNVSATGLTQEVCKRLYALLLQTSREERIVRVLGLLSKPWQRWARHNELSVTPFGPSTFIRGTACRAISLEPLRG